VRGDTLNLGSTPTMAIHKILLVDDSKTELHFLSELLTRKGFAAITRDPRFADVPVIMCTSKGLETDKVWGMRQGARDYVVKPVNADELIAKIHGFD
jgi:twitching motility two-component system response regulator PilH